MEEEKIENSIALHQGIIYEIEKIKQKIQESESEKIRFRVETKHWCGYFEPYLSTNKHKLNISKETMQVILDEAINKEKERINKLIDMEIERRTKWKKI
jgi:uncharacterized protein (UPF0128 family)